MGSKGGAYICWCACFFGFCGIHRFYLGKPFTGILWLCTFGFFYIGQIIDLFLISSSVEKQNDTILSKVSKAVIPTNATQYRPQTTDNYQQPSESTFIGSDLEKIIALKEKGILSEEEFKVKKEELLNKIKVKSSETHPVFFNQYIQDKFNTLFNPSKRIHISPNISTNVWNGASKFIKLKTDEQLLGIFDETLTKNASAGFALTTKRIYWQNDNEVNRVADYSMLKGSFNIDGSLRLGAGLKISINMLDNQTGKNLIVFLNEVCDAYRDGLSY